MKKRMVSGLLAIVGLTVGVASASVVEAPLYVRKEVATVSLVGPLVAERKGDNVEIRFTASEATDVEVTVQNNDGKIVRHLAAGLLGPNAPLPFKKDTLEQVLIWDVKDDAGRVVNGAVKIRVRLGMKTELDKYLGRGDAVFGPLRSVAVSDKGEVYVLASSWAGFGRMEMMVLDRDGRYLRTIMPYSAKTPAERAKSLGQLTIDGQKVPVVYSGHAHTLVPLTPGMPRQIMAWNPKGHMVVVSTLSTVYEHGLPRHLLAFDPQGGAPAGMNFVGPELRPPTGISWGHGEGDDPCFDFLAVSPDGKWIYYVPTTFSSSHCVYRLQWGEPHGSGMEADWFGQENRPGSGDDRLNDPQGLAVDAQGRVYICDRGNDRIVIVSPDAEKVGEFKVKSPEQIAIHPRTGEIYVYSRQASLGNKSKDTGPMSMGEYKAWKAREAERKARRPKPFASQLFKFPAWQGVETKPVATRQIELNMMALDPTSDQGRLWAIVKGKLTPMEHKGDTFELGEPAGGGKGLLHPAYVLGDPERNRVLVYQYSSNYKVFALDMDTGDIGILVDGLSDFAIAPDGSICGTGKFGSNEILRFAADGKPLPFEGSTTNVAKTGSLWIGNINIGARGVTVSPAGDIFLMRAGGEKGVQSRLEVYGMDGKLKKSALVDGLGIGDCGIGVDIAGNLYMGVNVKPADQPLPAEFQGKVPAANWLCWAQWTHPYRSAPWYYSMRNEYLYHLGAVMKFGPEGGIFYGRGSMNYNSARNGAAINKLDNAPDGTTEYLSGYLYQRVRVSGAEWRYAGMSVVPSSERMWGDPACVCVGSRLSVDGFGRVYVPKCMNFNIDVLDTAGNRLLRVGEYGNADDTDGVKLAWPAFVSAAGDRLFISDSVNRRVAVVKIGYAVDNEVAVADKR